ncbi:hypothetical protein AB0K14_23800 [Actinosynnema sp. NPDC050801]|uniref:hypothetical protein n=1 Tax=unclassified Actinosynnema TaxID=2637065 RepID=UPI0033CAD6DF
MAVDGITTATEESLERLRLKLQDKEIDINNHRRSPMNRLLVTLIGEAAAHSLKDPTVLQRFTDLNDAEFAYSEDRARIVGGTHAIVIWAGGKLAQKYLPPMRRKYVQADQALRTNRASTEQLAGLIYDGVPVHVAHQALDQEWIHPDAMRQVQEVLAEFVDDRITFHVPPDDSLIRLPNESNLPPGARPYQFSTAQRTITVPVPQPTPGHLIVITIGHGSSDGLTLFPPVGTVSPQVLANGIVPAPGAALVVPLQCYPMQSVQGWNAVTGWANVTSVSIPHLNESNDAEMIAWISGNLYGVIDAWFDDLA